MKVTKSPLGDAHEMEKLFAGMVRGAETYRTTAPGIGVGFHSETLGPLDAVAAGQTPSNDDIVGTLTLDKSLGSTSTAAFPGPFSPGPGVLLNDNANDDPTSPLDRNGIGLVLLEYARLAQTMLQDARPDVCLDPANCPPAQAPRRVLGDPACLKPNVTIGASGDVVLPQGCTGFEGFLTPAPVPASLPADEPYLDVITVPTFALFNGAEFATTLQPSALTGVFCVGSKLVADCKPTAGGVHRPLFTTSSQRAVAFASTSAASLPPEKTAPIVFARLYATALSKYLLAAGAGTETADAVHAVPLSPGRLIVVESPDNDPPMTSVDFQVVAHELATATQAPPAFHVVMDVANDTVVSYSFTRYLERSERAFFTVAAAPGAIPAGSVGDDATLTSVFGSPVLDAVWGTEPPGCAVGTGTGCTVGPPLDETGAIATDERGDPLLTRYASSIGHPGALTLGDVGVAIESTTSIPTDDGGTESFARASFPASNSGPFEALLRWEPVDVFGVLPPPAESKWLGFSGTTMDVGLAFVVGPPARPLGASSTRFEGRVFLCFDPVSKTLLSAALDDPFESLQAWVEAHPGAKTKCGLDVEENDVVTGSPHVASQAGRVDLYYNGASWRLQLVTITDPTFKP